MFYGSLFECLAVVITSPCVFSVFFRSILFTDVLIQDRIVHTHYLETIIKQQWRDL